MEVNMTCIVNNNLLLKLEKFQIVEILCFHNDLIQLLIKVEYLWMIYEEFLNSFINSDIVGCFSPHPAFLGMVVKKKNVRF